MLTSTVALLGCAALLIIWVAISRKLLGFLYVVSGIAAIVLCARSDQQVATMLSILFADALFTAVTLSVYALVRARMARGRVIYRRPAPARREVVQRRAVAERARLK